VADLEAEREAFTEEWRNWRATYSGRATEEEESDDD
jgi:hypothetical protein